MRLSFFGLVLTNPATFVSDFVVAVVCLMIVAERRREPLRPRLVAADWFFLLVGVSTLIGGCAHLFDSYWGGSGHTLAWTVNVVAVGCGQTAALDVVEQAGVRRTLGGLIGTQLLVALYLVIRTERFVWVILHAVLAFALMVNAVYMTYYLRTGDTLALNMPLAVAALAVPALTHSFNVRISDVLNHNVISHLLMIPGLRLLSRSFSTRPVLSTSTPPTTDNLVV